MKFTLLIFLLFCIVFSEAKIIQRNDCLGKLTLYSYTKTAKEELFKTIIVPKTFRKVKHHRIIDLIDFKGNCCWKIYKKENFKGPSKTLNPGFLTEAQQFFRSRRFRFVRSLKKVECWSSWNKNLILEIVLNTIRTSDTVFENHRKSLIQHCERSELRLHFEWTKVD